MPAGLLLASTLLPAAFQGVQAGIQRHRAKKLKESTYVPAELTANRDLAAQQAFSRRAPGQGFAEEQNRRNLATTIAAGARSGDVNKAAAITSSAVGQAYDANARLQAQGQQFSENAFARMAQANNMIAGQKRQNRNEYTQTKSELIAASDQNMFNALSGIGSAGVAFGLNGGLGGRGGTQTIPTGGDTIGINSAPAAAGQLRVSPYETFLPGGRLPTNDPYGSTFMGPPPAYRFPQFYRSPVVRKR